jgi:hypothetical protein
MMAARQEYFLTAAKPLRIKRRLLEEDCERRAKEVYLGTSQDGRPMYGPTKAAKRARTDAESKERTKELLQDPGFLAELQCPPPEACDDRLRIMHQAIVNKMKGMLATIAETGEVSDAVEKANAPNTSFIAEDVFQYTRMLHLRYPWITNGLMDGMRRVSKAPVVYRLSGSGLPKWWPPWLTEQKLSTRARNIRKHVWVSKQGRAELRTTADEEAEEAARVVHEKRADKINVRAEKTNEELGGKLVTEQGNESIRDADGRLLRGQLLDLRNFRAIARCTWTPAGGIGFGTKQKPTAATNGWTLTVLVNQLRLRNAVQHVSEFKGLIAKLDKGRVAMLTQKWELLLQKDKTLKVSGTRGAILTRLEAVLELEKEVKEAGKVEARSREAKAQRAAAAAERAAATAAVVATRPGSVRAGEEAIDEPRISKRARTETVAFDL